MPLLRTTPKTLRQAAHLDALASEIRDPLALERACFGRDPRGIGRRSGSARGGRRRAFRPSQVADLTLDLDADLGITLDGSSNVSAWADQSEQGNDASQGTAANRPAYTASDPKANGHATVNCDAASVEYLVVPHAASLNPSASGLTVYFVGYHPSDASVNDFLAKWVTNKVYQMRSDGADRLQFFVKNAADTANYIATVSGFGDNGAKIVRGRYASDVAGARIDSGAEVTDSSETGFNDGNDDLGIGAHADGGNPSSASFAKVLIYQRFVTDSEDARIMSYLSTRYGL